MKPKCSACGRDLELEQTLAREWVGEDAPSYGDTELVTVRCGHCGALNHVRKSELEASGVAEAPPKLMTRDTMREGIISILKGLYPHRTGYNGGHLAPVRDLDPDMFMSVLTELENEGIIEYNDTQIAMRLSGQFMEQAEKAS